MIPSQFAWPVILVVLLVVLLTDHKSTSNEKKDISRSLNGPNTQNPLIQSNTSSTTPPGSGSTQRAIPPGLNSSIPTAKPVVPGTTRGLPGSNTSTPGVSPSPTGSLDFPFCAYGSLPGIMRPENPAGSKWDTIPASCKLQNLLQAYATGDKKVANPPLRFLFMSDSEDMHTIDAYCNLTKGHVITANGHHKYNKCENTTTSDLLTVNQVYLATLTSSKEVELAGYAGKKQKYLDGYQAKMQLARGNWSELYPGQEPDLVIMGGGLWDLFRWRISPPDNLAPIERSVRKDKVISDELLLWWKNETRTAMAHAQKLFPKSELIWRNFAIPAWNPDNGKALNKHLVNKEFLVKMNSAGMAAAWELGVETVDVNAIVERYANPQEYLADMHHATAEVLLEFVNILLNIARRNIAAANA